MKVRLTYKKVVDRVFLPDVMLINGSLLAQKMGVTRARVSQMLQHGFPPAWLPALRSIELISVMGRQPYRKKTITKKVDK